MGKVKEELMNQEELRRELQCECMEAKMEMEANYKLDKYELQSKVNELLSDAKVNLMAIDSKTINLSLRSDIYELQMALNEIEGLINEG